MSKELNKILDLIKKKDLNSAKELCYQVKNLEDNFHFQNTFGLARFQQS